MRRIKMFMATCVVVLLASAGTVPALVGATPPASDPAASTGATSDTGTAKQTVCETLGAGADCSQDPNGGVSVNHIIKTIVNVLSFVIGVVSVIMVMVGGFRYVTSGGDSSKVSSAKGTITYAIVGIVIAALAQSIVRFVLKNVK